MITPSTGPPPAFQDKLRERAEKGTLSGTELTLMLAYAIGKPKDVLEIERPPESPMAPRNGNAAVSISAEVVSRWLTGSRALLATMTTTSINFAERWKVAHETLALQ